MNPSLSYMSAYPDIWKAYNQNNYGLSPNQYTQTHYQRYGQQEKRGSPDQLANYFKQANVPAWFQESSLNWGKPVTGPENLYQNWNKYNSNPGFRGIRPDQMQTFEDSYKNQLSKRGIYGDNYAEHMKYMNDPDVRLAAMNSAGIKAWKPQSSYMLNYPDVAKAYTQNSMGMTPQQYAQTHYENHGQREGRVAPPRTWSPNDQGYDMDYTAYTPPPVIKKGYEGVDGPAYISVNNQKYYGDETINSVQNAIKNPPQYNTAAGPRQMDPETAALFAKQQAEARTPEQIAAAGRARYESDPKFKAMVDGMAAAFKVPAV